MLMSINKSSTPLLFVMLLAHLPLYLRECQSELREHPFSFHSFSLYLLREIVTTLCEYGYTWTPRSYHWGPS